MITVDLDTLAAGGLLAPLDLHFARAMARLALADPEPVTQATVLAAALASRAVQQGHVCVDLRAIAGTTLSTPEGEGESEVPLPDLHEWLSLLRASSLVSFGAADEEVPRPLVLDERGRFYLHRYARYQQRLVNAVRARAATMEDVDLALLRDGLTRLFTKESGEEQQRHAAAVAVLRRLSVISGGPGTGKTFTVARILALLQEQRFAHAAPPLRIKALAPTGKAAQRLVESMTAAVATLACGDQVKESVLVPASTIHRALGFLPRTPTQFRHGRDAPLPADVVLVDEASMVDLALMAKLAEAVSPHARLILLGDKDQLASVEAGSLLADLYGDAEGEGRGPSVPMAKALRAVGIETQAQPRAEPGLGDGCIHLSRSRRYDEASGIGAFARAVNAGDGRAAIWVAQAAPDVRLLPPVGTGVTRGGAQAAALDPFMGTLGRDVLAAFHQLRDRAPSERLALLARFKILCAHRRGPAGAETINAQMESLLASAGVISANGLWYDGRPLLITANDPELELWNGDVGVVCHDAAGTPFAHFPGSNAAQTRAFAPARLPPHETVFAMTVHKSQGSEFEHVALLLPEKVSAVLTRELVYTAVTRAKARVDIYASPDVLEASILKRVARASGLRDALWHREQKNASVG